MKKGEFISLIGHSRCGKSTLLNDHRCTVLMITHDIDEALFLADRLVMMTGGAESHYELERSFNSYSFKFID